MPPDQHRRTALVSRHHDKSKKHNTLNTSPITYAVIELGSYHDVKVFHRCMSKCCRKIMNVSPEIGKGLTFAQKNAQNWPKYKKAIEDCKYSGKGTDEPDWWYISGHHGPAGRGVYAKDYDWGFFNEPYLDALHKDKLAGRVEDAIFMTNSCENNRGITKLLDSQKMPNPLHNKPRNKTKTCKGLFLIGCNTLSGGDVLLQLKKRFPDSISFGYFYAKAPGYTKMQKKHIEAIFRSVRKERPSFFANPQAYLAKYGTDESLKEIVAKISRRTKKRRIGAFYSGKMYIPDYIWGSRLWVHKWAFEKYCKVKLVLCPVKGKENPFLYSDDGKYIVGLKRRFRDGKIYENFRYSEFRGLRDSLKLNTWLLMVLQDIRSRVDAAVSPRSISDNGNEMHVTCLTRDSEKLAKFETLAKTYKGKGYLSGFTRYIEKGGTCFSLTSP